MAQSAYAESEAVTTWPDVDFAIEIDFQKGTESPSRVFKAMTALIETFEQLDATLARSVNVELKPVLLLEDIETGSLRAWLKSKITEVPDDVLATGDWKRVVGMYLVKAKRSVVNWTEGKTSITDRREVIDLEQRLVALAEETQLNHMQAYAPPDMREVLDGVQKVQLALSNLRPGDTAKFQSKEGDVGFNMDFHVAPETLEALLTARTIENRAELLLKVKKPDYLGESQWELRHGSRTITARIEDRPWLDKFQARQAHVRPGDALRARVRVEVSYGHDGELVGEHYFVEEVFEVIEPRPGETLPLLPE